MCYFCNKSCVTEDDAALCDLKGNAWQQMMAGGRPMRPRGAHTAVIAPNVGIVVFGGLSHEKGGYLSDVALLRVVARQRRAPEGRAHRICDQT